MLPPRATNHGMKIPTAGVRCPPFSCWSGLSKRLTKYRLLTVIALGCSPEVEGKPPIAEDFEQRWQKSSLRRNDHSAKKLHAGSQWRVTTNSAIQL